MKKRAAAEKREVGVYTTCHVVCRPTQSEAEAYYENYAGLTMADAASPRSLREAEAEVFRLA